MKRIIFIPVAFLILMGIGCQTLNNTQKGTGVGVAAGALVGGLIGKGSVWGILAGAAIGGTAGYFIGKNMDKQANELKQAVPSANVERMGEGINMTFDNKLLFKINSAEVNAEAKESLAAVASVMQKYPDTNMQLFGYTDDTGSDEYNLKLSQQRAENVASILKANGVAASRLTATGKGETDFMFENTSEENRAKNRRVEVAIHASEKMQQDAKAGKYDDGTKPPGNK
jgi:outer membrane protein OmpA-like peptidoglycan-associated protein